MSAFEASTPLLRTTATQLRAAITFARYVHDAARQSRGLACAAGDVAAGEAVEHFLDRWSYGMHLLEHDAAGLAEALTRAADAYDAVDRGVGESCR